MTEKYYGMHDEKGESDLVEELRDRLVKAQNDLAMLQDSAAEDKAELRAKADKAAKELEDLYTALRRMWALG